MLVLHIPLIFNSKVIILCPAICAFTHAAFNYIIAPNSIYVQALVILIQLEWVTND